MVEKKRTKQPVDRTQSEYEEDKTDLWFKWLSVPTAITTLLVAGSVLNLIGYFLVLKDDLGFSPTEQELVRWSVAFGYYGGIFAGPFVNMLGNKIWFILSAFLSLIGFIILGFYTDANYLQTTSSVLIILFLIIVSFAACMVTIASVSTLVKNFPRNIAPLLIAMIISYYMVAPYFEKCIRSGFLNEYSFKSTLIYSGIIQFWTYMVAAFVIKDTEYTPRLHKASSAVDSFGLTFFLILEGIFLIVIYFSWIIAGKWQIGFYLMILLIVLNFLTCILVAWLLDKKISETDIENIDIQRIESKKYANEVLSKPDYYWLLISTFIVVGSCTAFQLEAPTVAFAMGAPELGSNIMKSFWISDVVSRFAGGIFAALFLRILNSYLFAAVGSFLAMVGFGLALLSEPVSPVFFYISSFLIGSAVGIFWVVVPQIIINEGGTKFFQTLWGIVIFINILGVFVFDKTFMWIGDKEEPYEIGTCEGYDCYLASYIISSILWGFAGALCLFGYSNNIDSTQEKPSAKKRKSRSDKKDRRKKSSQR